MPEGPEKCVTMVQGGPLLGGFISQTSGPSLNPAFDLFLRPVQLLGDHFSVPRVKKAVVLPGKGPPRGVRREIESRLNGGGGR